MLVSLVRVFERLPRQLMPRLMIPFLVMYRRGPVRMGGKLVVFSGSLVRIIRHDFTLTMKTTYISTVAQVGLANRVATSLSSCNAEAFDR